MFNFFKDLFGSSNESSSRSHFWKDDKESFSGENFSRPNNNQLGFEIFTNPLEMHRYFESQLNSMLKSFGLPHDEMIFGNFLEEAEPQPPSTRRDLRDQYLKPGFQHPHSSIQAKSDDDLDGKISSANLDLIFSGKSSEEKPSIQTYSKKIMTKMFTDNNGIIKSHSTVYDHEGHEETIITYKRGDQEYTKITKTNKDGSQEIKENFLNMTEKDIKHFFGDENMTKDFSQIIKSHPFNWLPFNNFFK